MLQFLDSQGIGTRLLFAGNLVRQPYMLGRNFRVSGELTVTDKIMHDTFWIGVWPGLGEEHLGHVARCLEQFFGLAR